MKQVVCVDNRDFVNSLTIGKVYNVDEEYRQNEVGYLITTDTGRTGVFYYKRRFIDKPTNTLPEELFVI